MRFLPMSSLMMLLGCPEPEPEDKKGTPEPAGPPCDEGGEGDLEVVLDGLPSELWRQQPAVVLLSDGVEVERVEASTTLTLPSGRYTAEVWRGESNVTGVVGDLWVADLPITEACVTDGETEQLAVSFSSQPGHLWVSSGESLGAFTAEQVEAGGTQVADVRLDVALVNDFRGFAFDRMGHLWAATSPTYDTRLMLFTPEQLSGSGEAQASFELASPIFGDFAAISDVTFDEDGHLWMKLASGDLTWQGLVGFSRATLAEALLAGDDAEVEPDWVRPVEGLTGGADLELGPDGAIWLSFFDGDRYLRIDDPKDGGTGVDAEITVLYQTPTMGEPLALRGPENLAFDDDGDAVALFWTSNALVKMDGAELSGDGAHEVLLETDDLFVDQLPSGLVIDGAGRVWLGNYAGDGTGQILTWQSGQPAETWLVTEELPAPTDLVLDPNPR
jgi:hypothetical protein